MEDSDQYMYYKQDMIAAGLWDEDGEEVPMLKPASIKTTQNVDLTQINLKAGEFTQIVVNDPGLPLFAYFQIAVVNDTIIIEIYSGADKIYTHVIAED